MFNKVNVNINFSYILENKNGCKLIDSLILNKLG